MEVRNYDRGEGPARIVQWVYINLDRPPYEIDRCDSASMDFGKWRFNLRASNTEPLLRLNLGTRGG